MDGHSSRGLLRHFDEQPHGGERRVDRVGGAQVAPDLELVLTTIVAAGDRRIDQPVRLPLYPIAVADAPPRAFIEPAPSPQFRIAKKKRPCSPAPTHGDEADLPSGRPRLDRMQVPLTPAP